MGSKWEEDPLSHASWESPLSTHFTTGDADYEIFTAGGNSQGAAALLILNSLNQVLPSNVSRVHMTHMHISAKRVIYEDTYRKRHSQQLVENSTYTKTTSEGILKAFVEQRAISVSDLRRESFQDTEGLVVRDANGLTLSVLQSLALPFGSGIVVPSLGFPVHGRSYGFGTSALDENIFAPGARPWTTLSPYIVTKDGRFWMAASVKGGDRQPYAFTQIFLNLVQLNMSAVDAVAFPRFRDNSHHKKGAKHPNVEFDRPPYISSDGNNHESELRELTEALADIGYGSVVTSSHEITDSGFGLAQLVIDRTDKLSKDPSSLSCLTNLRR
jgi:gamma-glutamyltranspeptidase